MYLVVNSAASGEVPRLFGRQVGRSLILGWLVLLCSALAACGPTPAPQIEITGPTMGTYYAVKVVQPAAGLDTAALRAGVEQVLAAVIAEISTYEPESELSRLNRNPSTDWVPVSANLYRVIAAGQRISALSGGAFDVTVGPLVNLWGFGPEERLDAVPAPEQVRAALERVGYGKLELRADPPALRKQRGDIYIDLSALGEGYGADRLAAYLDGLGATNYMAAIAGTMRVRGTNAKRRPWGIAVEQPTPGQQAVQRILPVTDQAVSTSGDYRNFFEADGQRFSHHIDPKTGAPVAQRLASTTVIRPAGADSAMMADGFATALLVLGEQRGPALAASEILAAYFIIRDDAGFREQTSTAFERLHAP
jgi:FAD:protein FMN transferase